MFVKRLGWIARLGLAVLATLVGIMAAQPRAALAEQTQIPPEEYAALVALYNATDGPNWTYKWELPTSEPCYLWGVGCHNGHVRAISLGDNGLTGEIPLALLELSELDHLSLVGNALSGEIPPGLGATKLTHLNLDRNHLSGSIPPELGNLGNLGSLHFAYNALTGAIPPELGLGLPNLKVLYLNNNQLSGSIPATFGSLQGILTMDLSSNQLSGPIPTELGDLRYMRALSLSRNQLSGPIPASLGDLESLDLALYLSGNQLSGPIPPELGNLTKLPSLDLRNNRLSGPIPPELANMTSLRSFSLENNLLSGSIPPELANLGNLAGLNLSNNRLSGHIPPELGTMGGLSTLRLDNNRLSGPIPPELGTMGGLSTLRLDNNRLTGTIPAELGDLANLFSLTLNHNSLVGPIPASITQLNKLDQSNPTSYPTDFGHNHLWTDAPAVLAYLDGVDPGWAETQDVATLWVDAGDEGEFAWAGALGDQATIQVPAGAITEPLTLVYLPLADNYGLLGDARSAGLRFDLSAYRDGQRLDGPALALPVTITLTYRDAGVLWLDEEALALLVREGDDWLDAATTCDPPSAYMRDAVANEVRVAVCRLGVYALAGPLREGLTLRTSQLPIIRSPW